MHLKYRACLPLGALIPILCAGVVFAQVGQLAQKPSVGTVASAAALPATIPYSIQDGLIRIKAAVGNEQTQDAVIATGTQLSLITAGAASKLAIQNQGVVDLATLSGIARVPATQPQTLQIGRV